MTLMPTTVTPSRSRAALGPQISSWCAISRRCSDFTDPISRMVDRAPSEPRSILNVIHRRLSVARVCKGGARAVPVRRKEEPSLSAVSIFVFQVQSRPSRTSDSNLRATLFAVGNASVLLMVRAAIAGHLPGHRTVPVRAPIRAAPVGTPFGANDARKDAGRPSGLDSLGTTNMSLVPLQLGVLKAELNLPIPVAGALL